MKKLAKIIKVVAFILICHLVLTPITTALEFEHEMEADITMKEFYQLEKDSTQVMLFGTSHTTMGFSPMECYKQTKITSFNMSTAKQPIELAYYLLEESLKTQSPEVIILEAACLFYEKSDINTAKFRYSMDSMPLSLTKLKLASCYADYSEGVRLFSMGEAICPIYYYHDRWKEMNEEEMKVNKAIPHLKGQVLRVHTKEIKFDLEAADEKYAKKIAKDPDEAVRIRKSNMDYLLKFKKVCEENDMKLLLCATPTLRWNSTKKQLVEDVCKEQGLDFIDMNLPDGEILDYSTDMADGNHVNTLGAKKLTKVLYDFIIENYGVKGSVNEEFENSMKYYDAYCDNMIKYTTETDFENYLNLINENKEDLTIFICSKGEMTAGLQPNDKKLLKELGCTIPFDETNYENSYIAVIDEGKLVYEDVNKESIAGDYVTTDGKKVKLYSNGHIENSKAEIEIEDKEYAISGAGLNIVLYDKESCMAIDSASFNTHYSQRKWYRSDDRALELFMFRNYKYWVAENY